MALQWDNENVVVNLKAIGKQITFDVYLALATYSFTVSMYLYEGIAHHLQQSMDSIQLKAINHENKKVKWGIKRKTVICIWNMCPVYLTAKEKEWTTEGDRHIQLETSTFLGLAMKLRGNVRQYTNLHAIGLFPMINQLSKDLLPESRQPEGRRLTHLQVSLFVQES